MITDRERRQIAIDIWLNYQIESGLIEYFIQKKAILIIPMWQLKHAYYEGIIE